MVAPKLTIGMATFDDFHGVYFSVQALRMYHPEVMDVAELLVVDNNPSGAHGQAVKNFLGWVKNDVHSARYIEAPDIVGTSAPRDLIFREASGDAVLAMDGHVFFTAGSLKKLLKYYAERPRCRDLMQGPMLYDNLGSRSTHFKDQWRGEMWGTWDTDPRGDPGSATYSDDAFEIPGQGLGMFTCRRDAWLGFNPEFRGFGGEEMYIHEKYRQAGARALCIPWLTWLHRFGRPDGVKYPLTTWNKVRNYVIGHAELGLPMNRIYDHFVLGRNEDGTNLGPKMPQHEWDALMTNPRNPPRDKPGAKVSTFVPAEECKSCKDKAATLPAEITLEALYESVKRQTSDINEHTPKLRELSEQAQVVVEFGMRRGVSTVALLAGQPKFLFSYDLNNDPMSQVLKERQGKTEFHFSIGNSLEIDIPPCDLLFIDTKHTADQLYGELTRHAPRVRGRIAMHDTQIFGERGEDGKAGLLPALRKFLGEQTEWSVIYHAANNNGFTVISRLEADKPKVKPGVIEMAVNLAAAVTAHVADGAKKASKEQFKERLEICSICPQRNGDRCTICGCFLAEKAAMRKGSTCPIGKWPVIDDSCDKEKANAATST